MRFGLLLVLLVVLSACNRAAPPEPGTLELDRASTLNIRVVAGSDDAEENVTGTTSLSSTDLELTRDANQQTVGMRFRNVTIPPGAVINSATIQFMVDDPTSEATALTIQGQATDNAPAFAAAATNISSRSRTAASISWTPAPWTTAGATDVDQRTPELATILQELINRPGWASGNAVVFIVTGTGKRIAEAYEGGSTRAPLLRIDYTIPSSYDLTVNKQGGGTVTGSGINCGDTCTANYLQNTPVTLTATPDNGFTFSGWSGDCSGTGDCILTMDANKTVTATFTPLSLYTLSVTKAGSGTGTVTGTGISCGSDCEEIFTPGTSVTLNATAAGDSSFAGWSGACSGTGTCTVTLNANISVTATFNLIPPPTNEIVSISQTRHFLTGCTYASLCATGQRLPIPSTDPAGIVYHSPSNTLFIVDSEVEELAPPRNTQNVFANINRNAFRVPLLGNTFTGSWNFRNLNNNHEPTGIAYCANDNHFYISNDDAKRIYRYAFNGTSFTLSTSVATPANADAEDIACDPTTGRIYVAGGTGINIYVYSFNGSSFTLLQTIDLFATAGNPLGVPSDPEGIAFDTVSRRIFLVSGVDKAIFEYTEAGAFVKRFDLSAYTPVPIAVQGLTIGPASGDPQAEAFYIADGGIDNNDDPNERDGIIYEARIQR